jgi:hypothetical protein
LFIFEIKIIFKNIVNFISPFSFESRSHYIAQAGLELAVLLLQPPDDRYMPSFPVDIYLFILWLIGG